MDGWTNLSVLLGEIVKIIRLILEPWEIITFEGRKEIGLEEGDQSVPIGQVLESS